MRSSLALQEPCSSHDAGSILKLLRTQDPGSIHLSALTAAVLLRTTNLEALGALLDLDEPEQAMRWLRSLSFMVSDSATVHPTAEARSDLLAQLRQQDRESFRTLYRRGVEHYFSSLYEISPEDPKVLGVLYDLAHLYRLDTTPDRDFYWTTDQPLVGYPATDADWPLVRKLVLQCEGPEALAAAELWRRKQPEGVLVYRDGENLPAGVSIIVRLSRSNVCDLEQDPATSAVWEYLERRAKLRSGECALLTRSWFARDEYQYVSFAQSSMWLDAMRRYVTVPRLAYSLVAFSDPDYWADAMEYFNFTLTGVGYRGDGIGFGVYGHDWRKMPPTLWLAYLAERPLAATEGCAALTPTEATTNVPERPSRTSEIRLKAVGSTSTDEPLAGVEIGSDGSWFTTTDGRRVDLSRRKPLKRILERLLQARVDEPGTSLSLADIQEAGWPGERMLARAASGRVYVAICTLRKLGLDDILTRADKGYLLHSAVPVRPG